MQKREDQDELPVDADIRPASDDVDDQFRALMEGLRTTLPGVQVLFAFLLTLPLMGGFADLDAFQDALFLTAFISSALASVMLISPSVHQRARAQISGLRRRTPSHVESAVRLAQAGTIFLVVSLTSASLLITSVVIGWGWAMLIAGGLALVIGWAWFYLPLVAFGSEDS